MKPELEDDPDWEEYVRPDTIPSCDKGGHKERSLANQPNHIIFWKKLFKKQGQEIQGSEVEDVSQNS